MERKMISCYSWMQTMSANGKSIFSKPLQNSTLMSYIIPSRPELNRTIYPYLPHLLGMIVLIVFVSRILHRSIRFSKQPLIVCQLLTGFFIFSFLQSKLDVDDSGGILLPNTNRRSEHVLDSVGILFSVFIAAVKVDPTDIWQFGKKKPLIIGLSSLFIPMAVGLAIFALKGEEPKILNGGRTEFIILVLYPICTTYPVAIYEILAELGLLNSELGRLALSSSLIQLQVTFVWSLLISYTVMREGKKTFLDGFVPLLSSFSLIAIIVLFIRPYALRIARTTPPFTRVREVHILVITLLVFLMGLWSDLSGSTTYGDAAIMTGLAIPEGPPLGTALIDRVDVVTSEVLLPLVFMHQGVYMDWIGVTQKLGVAFWLGLLVLVTFLARIVVHIGAARYCKMSLKDGVLLGFIMNFRGLVDMLVFIRFANTNLMDKTTFAVLVLMTITVTAICAPVVSIYYKPLGVRKQLGIQAVQRARFHAELNVMTCFYDDKPIQALLEFLESLSCSLEKDKSTCIYCLHLVEQQGRAASRLICHRHKKGHISSEQMDPVHNHFLNIEQATRRTDVSVTPFTSVAPLNTMHHDIFSLVLEKTISLIIVPYPSKNSIADLEARNATHELVPLVLQKAPCSVGIMVYHGITKIIGHANLEYNVGVLFWGGPDDRESIAIGSRMARHPCVYLSVFRFISCGSTKDQKIIDNDDKDNSHQKGDDDKIIAELQVENVGNNRVTVSEINVKNEEQFISAIRAIAKDFHDLLIVGRRQKSLSIIGDDLEKWTESRELGVIGDILAADTSCIGNVLIIQQHTLSHRNN